MRYGAEMLGWYRTNAGTKKENGKKEERIRPIVDGTETSYSKNSLVIGSSGISYSVLVKGKADIYPYR